MTVAVLAHLAAFCARLTPRRRLLLALALGVLCSFAMPPYGIFPVLWFGFPCLLLLLEHAARPREAFALGWCFAFGYFTCGLYWIAASMLVDFARFFWLIPFSVAGLPAILALYYGLAALLWRRWRSGRDVADALLFALLCTMAEYLRGHLFSGFPWNLFGYAWTAILPIAQTVSLFGSYGLTLLTLAVACLPFALLRPSRRAWGANLAALTVLLAFALWGSLRLQTPTDYLRDAYVRLVQPNIAQAMKWSATAKEKNFQTLISLSAAASAQPVTHLIWPESAVTFFLAEDAGRRAQLSAALPPDSILLTGSDRRLPNYAANRWDYYNSLLALDHAGDVIGIYDKVHLVPFGEYVPFRGFGPIASATSDFGSFEAGAAPQTLTVPGLPPFSPFICYEAVFPGAVTAAMPRPRLLINITNDAWYGETVGPYQHLAIARMRAIEEGLPLLRAANTGISAVVDAYGRTLQHLPLDQSGVLDTAVPAAATTVTWYAAYRELPALLLFLALGAAHLALRRSIP